MFCIGVFFSFFPQPCLALVTTPPQLIFQISLSAVNFQQKEMTRNKFLNSSFCPARVLTSEHRFSIYKFNVLYWLSSTHHPTQYFHKTCNHKRIKTLSAGFSIKSARIKQNDILFCKIILVNAFEMLVWNLVLFFFFCKYGLVIVTSCWIVFHSVKVWLLFLPKFYLKLRQLLWTNQIFIVHY